MATARSIQQGQDAARSLWREGGAVRPVNVGRTERLASQVGGGVLLVAGLARGGLKGLALAGIGGALIYRGTTGHCPVLESLGLDTTEADPHPGPFDSVKAQHGDRSEQAVIIDRPADDIYLFWRDHANLPRFMSGVSSVQSTDGIRSHWVMETPLGTSLEWDAEIYNDEPGRLIAWRSLPGSQVDTAGSVHFRPIAGGRGTEVRVNQKFDPPGGSMTLGASRLLGNDPANLTRESLRRLKQMLEAGEVPTIAGQPSGRV